jgi:hypothetical protein
MGVSGSGANRRRDGWRHAGFDDAGGWALGDDEAVTVACGLLPGHWIHPSTPERRLPIPPPELLHGSDELTQGVLQTGGAGLRHGPA